MSYSVTDILEFVEENDVKFIRLAFCDIYGQIKNVSIMPYQLANAFEEGIAFDASSIKGFRDVVSSDLLLKPDPNTLAVLPWRPQTGRVVRFYCDIYTPEGERFEGDSRALLQKTTEHMEEIGFECNMGAECEFYLFKKDDNGYDTMEPIDAGSYFDMAPLDRGENIRREICLSLEEMSIYPESSHHEAGPGQNEVVFRFADALTTADNILTFKNLVGAIAMRNGMWASFNPKPLKNYSGNGFHINVSLFKDGKNIFDADNGEDQEKGKQFMAGVLNRIREATLFFNTLPESYSRFGFYEAPKYISWSRQNRSQLMRLPSAKGERHRFELRSPDPCVNPYICFVLLIEAGIEGIEKKMVLPEPTDIDLNSATKDEVKNLEVLPMSLEEAIKLAEKSEFVRRVLGEDITRHFIELKKEEL